MSNYFISIQINLELMQKITVINQTFTQLSSRITQLERKKERLKREFITQNSQLESIESQIKLVKENYADPQLGSLGNELTFLNNRLVKQEETAEKEIKILIVDDEPYNVLGLQLMISQLGYKILNKHIERAFNGL